MAAAANALIATHSINNTVQANLAISVSNTQLTTHLQTFLQCYAQLHAKQQNYIAKPPSYF